MPKKKKVKKIKKIKKNKIIKKSKIKPLAKPLDKKSISDSIKITAESDAIIMALSPQQFDVKGLQFHPEYILTPQGGKLIENWIAY